MHDEDDQPKPLSSEPLHMAQRLRGYIVGLIGSTERDKEDPPWFISLCSREAKPHIERAQGCREKLSSAHPTSDHAGATSPTSEAGGTAGEHTQKIITEQLRKKHKLRPHMQRWLIKRAMSHVLRLEYHLRCFILFLTARIIEMGRVGEPPEPRAQPQPRGLTYAQRQDQEMRENRRELPRLNGFKVLTPVILSTGKRKRPRRPRPYHMLPDDLKVIDAGHVFTRLKRLEHVLANADKFAMSLAISTVAQVPALIPAQAGTSFNLAHPDSRFRGNERIEFNDGGSPQIPAKAGIHASESTSSSLSVLRHGHPPSRVSAETTEPVKHPLYFAPLANFCPPAQHYDSSPDPDQKRDFNLIHWLASSGLEQIGLGVRPDPFRGLPDLSCLDPPPPPQVRSL